MAAFTSSSLGNLLFISFLFISSCFENMETFSVSHHTLCNQAVMDVIFPLEGFVYDSHYPFQSVSLLHSVLLRNGLVV